MSSVTLSDSLTGLWLYDCNMISDSRRVDIVKRENWRKIFVNGSSLLKNDSSTESNAILPDSISFSWFSFHDETFYQLKASLPHDIIMEWLEKNQIKIVEFNFIFNIDGKINVMLQDYLNESKRLYLPKAYKASILKNHFWNETTNREEDVALVNYSYFTPCYIHRQNSHPQEYIELNAGLKLNTLHNYFSNPDKDGKMNILHTKRDKGIPENISIEIKDSINDKSKSFFIDFTIPKNEIYSVLRANPKSELELHIKMNELDSIQEIYFKDSKQIFHLNKPSINYRLQEYGRD